MPEATPAATPIRLWRELLERGVGTKTLSGQCGVPRWTLQRMLGGRVKSRPSIWKKILPAVWRLGIAGTRAELEAPLGETDITWCQGRAGLLQDNRRLLPPLVHIRAEMYWTTAVTTRRAEMITSTTWQRMGLTDNPWREPTSGRDLFMSQEAQQTAEAIAECADTHGFLAIAGVIGSGKSDLVRYALEQLAGQSQYRICHVLCLDRGRINARTILEAMVRDLIGPDERCPSSQERLANKVRQHQASLMAQGKRILLVVDEAQLLHPATFTVFKRLREITQVGFRKGCGVVLIGQTQSDPDLLKRLALPVVQAAAQRMTIIELSGLSQQIRPYLDWAMRRAGAGNRRIITERAMTLLEQHYAKIQVGYLELHEIISAAMREALSSGLDRVDDEPLSHVLGERLRSSPTAESETVRELDSASRGREAVKA